MMGHWETVVISDWSLGNGHREQWELMIRFESKLLKGSKKLPNLATIPFYTQPVQPSHATSGSDEGIVDTSSLISVIQIHMQHDMKAHHISAQGRLKS